MSSSSSTIHIICSLFLSVICLQQTESLFSHNESNDVKEKQSSWQHNVDAQNNVTNDDYSIFRDWKPFVIKQSKLPHDYSFPISPQKHQVPSFINVESPIPLIRRVKRSPGYNCDIETPKNYRFSNTGPRITKEALPIEANFFNTKNHEILCTSQTEPDLRLKWYGLKIDFRPAETSKRFELMKTLPGHYIVKNGSIRFPASNLTWQGRIFCTAENPLGLEQSHEIAIKQVPNIFLHSVIEGKNYAEITYNVLNAEDSGKAVIECYPKYHTAAQLSKLAYIEVYNNNNLPSITLTKTAGRYHLVNIRSNPQLHIYRMQKNEMNGSLKVVCVFESTIQPGLMFQTPDLTRFPVTFNNINYKKRAYSIDVRIGSTLEIPCTTPYLTKSIVWQHTPVYGKKDEKLVIDANSITLKPNDRTEFLGDDRGNIRLVNVSIKDRGFYACTVPVKGYMYDSTFVNVYEPIRLSLKPDWIKVTMSPNCQVELQCRIYGWPYPKISFRHNGVPITTNSKYTIVWPSKIDYNMERTVVLKINNMDHNNTGVYQCFAESDEHGEIYASSYVAITRMAPELTYQYPQVDPSKGVAVATFTVGKPLELRCTFAGYPIPNISWYLNNNKVPLGDTDLYPKARKDSSSQLVVNALLKFDHNRAYSEHDLLQVGGMYRAEAVNRYNTTSCETMVLVDADLHLQTMPEVTQAILDRPFKLYCHFVARGWPEIEWTAVFKNITKVMPVDHNYMVDHKTSRYLLFFNLRNEDEAEYTCTAKLRDTTKITKTYLRINVAPRITEFPEAKRYEEDDTLRLDCSPEKTLNDLYYTWWEFQPLHASLDSKPIVIDKNFCAIEYMDIRPNHADVSRISWAANVPRFAKENPKGSAFARCTPLKRKTHAGNYTCVIQNAIDVARRSILITFPPILDFEIRPPNTKSVILGQNLVINCTAKPDSPGVVPHIYWQYYNKDTLNNVARINDYRFQEYDNGTLIIKSVTENDPTKLLCIMQVEKDIKSSVVNVQVHIPARIKPIKAKQEKKKGTRVEIACQVEGDDIDRSVVWERSKNGYSWEELKNQCEIRKCNITDPYQPIPSYQQEINKLKTMVVNKLVFDKIDDSHIAKYRCKARNLYTPANIHYVYATVDLMVISVPGLVILDKGVTVATSHSVTLFWSPPEIDGNKPIKNYIVKYGFHKSDKIASKESYEAKVLGRNERTVTLTHLRPHRQYQFNISALNDVGEGEPVEIQKATKQAKPEGPVMNLVATGISSEGLEIEWDPPDPDKQNGIMKLYYVCVQKLLTPNARLIWAKKPAVGGLGYQCDAVEAKEDNTAKMSVRFNDLTKFTAYAIEVTAQNAIDFSPPAYTKSRTLEDLPNAEPVNVTCTKELSGRQLLLSWNPPVKDKLHGILKEYKIKYYMDNDKGDETSQRMVNETKTHHQLVGLEPDTVYVVKVMAANSKGEGPSSTPIYCRTNEADPSPPTHVKANPVNATSIVVSWGHPLRPNGQIKKYCVKATQILNGYVSPEQCVNADLSRTYNFAYIKNLKELHDYNVSVYAMNKYASVMAFLPTPVKPSYDAPNSIISINQDLRVSVGTTVYMDCQDVRHETLNWDGPGMRYKHELKPNNTLILFNVTLAHQGTYRCWLINDFIIYDLQVDKRLSRVPQEPLWLSHQPNKNSIQISWVSQGTVYKSDPAISGFYVNWFNEYRRKSGSVRVDVNERKFYLEGLECGTQVEFQICAVNDIGNSSLSQPQKVRTLGGVPAAPSHNDLLPGHNIFYTGANFNLSAFYPSADCPAENFQIIVAPSSAGNFPDRVKNADIVHKFNRYDIQKSKGCFNVTQLQMGSSYNYEVTARNAAGEISVFGHFTTLSIPIGRKDIDKTKSKNELSLIDVKIIIPLIVFLMIMLVIAISVILYCLRKAKESDAATNGGPPMAGSEEKKLPGMMNRPDIQNRKLPHPMNRSFTGPQSRMPPYPLPKDGRIYARGVYDPRMGRSMTEQNNEDRLSTTSMDSDGNLNPYATYEGATREAVDAEPAELAAMEAYRAPMEGRLRASQRRATRPNGNHAYNYPSPGFLAGRQMSYENDSRMGTLTPERRVSSLDDLSNRGGPSGTYSRGYAGDGVGHITDSSIDHGYYDSTTGPSAGGTSVHPSNHRGLIILPPNRTSVLSSTTCSSNHDELDQAYEYGRNRGYLTLPGRRHQNSHVPMLQQPLPQQGPGEVGVTVSGESGESETTDPGILRFTQQPPRPDEARRVTCEVPMYSKQSSAPAGVGHKDIPQIRPHPDQRRQPLHRGISECSDTYEAVDYQLPEYSGMPPGASGVKMGPGAVMVTSYPNNNNNNKGGHMANRHFQPLPDIPAGKKGRYTRGPGRSDSDNPSTYDYTSEQDALYYGPPGEQHALDFGPSNKVNPRQLAATRYQAHGPIPERVPLMAGTSKGLQQPIPSYPAQPSETVSLIPRQTSRPLGRPPGMPPGPEQQARRPDEESVYTKDFTIV